MIGPIRFSGRAGFLSEDGEFLIEPVYADMGLHREERISFRDSDKVGFLDAGGEIAIPPQFESEREMPHFSGGLAPVRSAKGIGYIDKMGEWRIQPQFERGWDFRDDKCIVETSGDGACYLCINSEGQTLSRISAYLITGRQDWPDQWDCFPVYVDASSDVQLLTQWINWRNEIVFAPRFPYMTNWCDGVSAFCEHEDRVGEPWGLVSASGQILRKPCFYGVTGFSNGLARAGRLPDELGFINSAGEWVIEPTFRYAARFSDGLACVALRTGKYRGNKGFINLKGEMIIEPRFNRAWGFHEGYAQVEYDGKRAVIDATGHVIWETKIEPE